MSSAASHEPVLYDEALAGLQVVTGGHYIDGTVGAGGHAAGILEASAPSGLLLGIDLDPNAIEISRHALARYGHRAILVHGSYARLDVYARRAGLEDVDGVVIDLGFSSMQVDDPKRGFSFQESGPLDMRFDPTSSRTAADLVNELPERELADLIYRYGEEPASRAIARAIVAARPLQTTAQLAEVVARVAPRRKIHPATRTFQALRMAVNDELEVLRTGLRAALSVLKSGGRLAVIAFHSLEDGEVKRFFARESRDCVCPPEALVCTCNHKATLRVLSRKPVRPCQAEVDRNPRSRSARLRIAVKL